MLLKEYFRTVYMKTVALVLFTPMAVSFKLVSDKQFRRWITETRQSTDSRFMFSPKKTIQEKNRINFLLRKLSWNNFTFFTDKLITGNFVCCYFFSHLIYTRERLLTVLWLHLPEQVGRKAVN